MGLRLKSEQEYDVISIKEMNTDQIGVIVDKKPNYNFNKIIMRTYEGDFVCLCSGDKWSGDRELDINVRLLPKGTEFVID